MNGTRLSRQSSRRSSVLKICPHIFPLTSGSPPSNFCKAYTEINLCFTTAIKPRAAGLDIHFHTNRSLFDGRRQNNWHLIGALCFLALVFRFHASFAFFAEVGSLAAATPESLIRNDETQGECGKSLWLQPLGRGSGDFLIFLHMLKIPRSPLTERRFKRAVFLSSFLWGEKKTLSLSLSLYIYIYICIWQDEDSHHITSSEQADVIKRLFSLLGSGNS